jgi:hypothetical protein
MNDFQSAISQAENPAVGENRYESAIPAHRSDTAGGVSMSSWANLSHETRVLTDGGTDALHQETTSGGRGRSRRRWIDLRNRIGNCRRGDQHAINNHTRLDHTCPERIVFDYPSLPEHGNPGRGRELEQPGLTARHQKPGQVRWLHPSEPVRVVPAFISGWKRRSLARSRR